MKKILFIGQFPPPLHGVSVINGYLCDELEKTYHVTRYDYKFNDDLKSINESSKVTKIIRFVFHFLNIFKLIVLSSGYEYIYFTPNVKGGVFYRDLILIQLFRLSKASVYLHLHGLGVKANLNAMFRVLYKMMFFRNNIIHVSEKVLNEEFSGTDFGVNTLSYLNNSVDFEVMSSFYQEYDKESVLVYMANFRQSKGTLDVLDVYNNIRKVRTCKLLMIGGFTSDSFEKEVLNYIDNKAIEGVEILGFLDGDLKYSKLASGTVFLYPSYDDSFGLVVLEAQALGLPVCAYDIGSMSQIINRRTGRIVNVGDTAALEVACNSLLDAGKSIPDSEFLRDYNLKDYVARFVKIIEG